MLELGSGTGAVGLYAAALGASRVVLTDGGPPVAQLQWNPNYGALALARAGRTLTLGPAGGAAAVEP